MGGFSSRLRVSAKAAQGVKGQGVRMHGHIGASLGAIGAVAAIIGAAMAGLGAPWWAWTGFVLWGLLWVTAASGLSDLASRRFLAGTLRKSTFTQIYTTLARRNVMGIWNRLCDPASDTASVPAFFRAALTWRLYDLALRLAVAYPLVLLVGQWVVTGAEGRVGSFVVLPAAEFWPERAAVLLIVLLLTGGFVGDQLASASQRPLVKKVAGWLFPLAGAVAFAVAVAGAVAVAVAVAIEALDRLGKQRLARILLTGFVTGGVLLAATTLDWGEVPEDRRSLFLFLAVLPLINALFDVVSYAVTLTLIRRGLRAKLPFLFGLADLGLACVLLLGLGATLVAVIHGLNLAAGVPFVDLPALFEGVQADPWAYLWLYLMLFSTLLPTLLHGVLSLLGLQGIWTLGLRRPVAGWVDAAPASPLHAIRASLGLSLIWALPLLGLAGVLWGIWHYAQPLLMDGLQLYLDGLLWIATHPVGAI